MPNRPIGDIAFKAYLGEGKLMGSRCNTCGKRYAPPRGMCVTCNDADMEWAELSGSGKLAAFTCISVVPGYMREAGFGKDNPYCVGVVSLGAGLRVVARIIGVDTRNPETIQIGTPMTVEFLYNCGGRTGETVLAFKPAAA